MLNSFAPKPINDLSVHAEEGADHSGMVRLAWNRIAAGVQICLGPLVAHLRRLSAARELERLDDRMLKDIGISRSDISRVVRYGRGM
jgi:uncharacterized protein YjiS (DUF1127 family)